MAGKTRAPEAIHGKLQEAGSLLKNDRLRSAIELTIVLGLIEIWLWSSTSAIVFRIVAGIAIAVILLKNILRPNADAWNSGLPTWDAYTSWRNVIAVTLVLGVTAFAISGFLYVEGETWRPGRIEQIFEIKRLPEKIFIIAVQQAALCLFLFPVLYRISRSRSAALVLAAVTFGLLHLPSLFLAAIVTAMAALWLFLFGRTRRLPPLIVSHFVLAVLAAALFPERLTYNLAVGRNALPTAQNYERLAIGDLAAKFGEWKSDAYYRKNGNSDRDFIIALYRDVLRRSAPKSEIEILSRRLQESNRAEIVARFMKSKEYLALRCRVDRRCD
ncbi:MAG: CPBP family intramembrane metalloprotease [Xanthobacteraceae bacterium]|nr:CPBP family intramembrane metalloprotease [Xanthobacteraceae bacterium]MBX3534690.1 CPBP family intramembrane metalloprotease [Xanthobacteraceae bacterium]MCW5675155.1 CPBP family intramembrane metalloprotease [Xanthobacteraceae bacterium]MCW5676804.1 CPBP family intramembrane metalloprotease [Xanthobacteraceae bacterium]